MKPLALVLALLFSVAAVDAAEPKSKRGGKTLPKRTQAPKLEKATGCQLHGYTCVKGLSCELGPQAGQTFLHLYTCKGSGQVKNGCPRGWNVRWPKMVDDGGKLFFRCEIQDGACTTGFPVPRPDGHGYRCEIPVSG